MYFKLSLLLTPFLKLLYLNTKWCCEHSLTINLLENKLIFRGGQECVSLPSCINIYTTPTEHYDTVSIMLATFDMTGAWYHLSVQLHDQFYHLFDDSNRWNKHLHAYSLQSIGEAISPLFTKNMSMKFSMWHVTSMATKKQSIQLCWVGCKHPYFQAIWQISLYFFVWSGEVWYMVICWYRI